MKKAKGSKLQAVDGVTWFVQRLCWRQLDDCRPIVVTLLKLLKVAGCDLPRCCCCRFINFSGKDAHVAIRLDSILATAVYRLHQKATTLKYFN